MPRRKRNWTEHTVGGRGAVNKVSGFTFLLLAFYFSYVITLFCSSCHFFPIVFAKTIVHSYHFLFCFSQGHIDGTERNRASPQAICKLYKHINEDQRAAIRDMGTGALLDIKCGYLHNTLVTWFTRLYHSGRKGFVVPRRGFIPLTEESVHNILGIPQIGRAHV